MNIETKFDINDEVHFIHELKPVCGFVRSIDIDITANNIIRIWYNVNIPTIIGNSGWSKLSEDNVYKSKEELQVALFGEK